MPISKPSWSQPRESKHDQNNFVELAKPSFTTIMSYNINIDISIKSKINHVELDQLS